MCFQHQEELGVGCRSGIDTVEPNAGTRSCRSRSHLARPRSELREADDFGSKTAGSIEDRVHELEHPVRLEGSDALIDADETNREVRERLWSACEHPVEPLEVQINQTASIGLAGRFSTIDSGVLDVYSTEMTKLPDRSELEVALADLGAGYDHIVLHTAPAFGSPAAVRWSAAAGGTVLVVTSEIASARTVEQCVLTLSRGARHFIGAVFDERPRSQRRTPLIRRLFGGGARVGGKERLSAPAAVGSATRPAAQPSGQS